MKFAVAVFLFCLLAPAAVFADIDQCNNTGNGGSGWIFAPPYGVGSYHDNSKKEFPGIGSCPSIGWTTDVPVCSQSALGVYLACDDDNNQNNQRHRVCWQYSNMDSPWTKDCCQGQKAGPGQPCFCGCQPGLACVTDKYGLQVCSGACTTVLYIKVATTTVGIAGVAQTQDTSPPPHLKVKMNGTVYNIAVVDVANPRGPDDSGVRVLLGGATKGLKVCH